MSALDWAKLLLLGSIWGGSFFFARIAVSEVHPLMLVLLRVAIAATALHVYLAVRGPSFRVTPSLAGRLLLLGTVNNALPFSLIFIGQTQMGAGLASVLNATTPFWTILIANAFIADERLSWNKLLGVLLGIAGVAVMVGPGIVASLGGAVWAKFAVVGASISYAVALVFARGFKGVPPIIMASGQLTAATAIMLPIALLTSSPGDLLSVSMPVWAAVLAIALLSTAFAYILFFGLISSAGATNASLTTLIVPVSAILLGFVFLGERLAFFEVVGMALIGLGLTTIDGRILRRLKRMP
jgi:drug/metabolite transporter (DMT)-like permease